LVTDPAGNIIAINETGAQRLGMKPDELVGSCVYDWFPAELAVQRRAWGDKVVASGRGVRFSDQRGGMFFDIAVYPILDQDRRFERAVIFGRDITEQHVAQEALQLEKRKFESLCEHAPFGMVKVGKNGEFQYINRKFEEMFGYDLSDIPTGKEWLRVAYPDDRYRTEVIRAWIDDRAQAQIGQPRDRVFDVQCKDGTKKTIHFTSVELDLGDDLTTVEDITDRLATQAALRQSEERFRAIFEAAPDCIFIKDVAFRYTHVNPAMEKLFGITASEMIGRTDETLFADTLGYDTAEIDLRILCGEPVEEEHAITVKGVSMTFSVLKSPMYDNGGRMIGVCGIARDITERKRADQAMLLKAMTLPNGVGTENVSPVMRSVMTVAAVIAKTDSTVLLQGESGTGKDYLARFIHNNSKRAGGPYLVINCASVAGELADSELFGHEAGAFTGASRRKRGLLELAERGTLLLNEVGELSPAVQAKLLTFLDTREFTRVGGEKATKVNTRLIAATNKDLVTEVAEGRFRKDLFYRLDVISIKMPPLRERIEDLQILVQQILDDLAFQMQLPRTPSVAPSVMGMFLHYDWPGNIRELRNVLERALIISRGGKITRDNCFPAARQEDWSVTVEFPKKGSLNDVIDDVKRLLLTEALRRASGNRTRAARMLGISRFSVINYVKSLGMTSENESPTTTES
jgi:PAS domain S-box-containing protein